MAENELLGPRSGPEGKAPPWWLKGRRIKRAFDGQEAIASFTVEGKPMVLIQRGVTGVMRQEANPNEWETCETDAVVLTPLQIARCAYEADRALRTGLGQPGVPEWSGLIEQDRIQFMWGVFNSGSFVGEYAKLREGLALAIARFLELDHER